MSDQRYMEMLTEVHKTTELLLLTLKDGVGPKIAIMALASVMLTLSDRVAASFSITKGTARGAALAIVTDVLKNGISEAIQTATKAQKLPKRRKGQAE
jgi:hypothetical protein